MAKKTILLIVVSLLFTAQHICAEEENYPPGMREALERDRAKIRINVTYPIEREWVSVPNVNSTTHSAIMIRRAVNTETGKPFDASYPFGCDLKNLRREFNLEKTEYFLGEPILVEFQIELTGEGEWKEPTGGNYRARGRDDNFLFLMRDANGNWLKDTCGEFVLGFGGGLGSERTITKKEKFSYWVPVQHWCVIEEPGVYDLFCFYTRRDHALPGRYEAIFSQLPEEVLENYIYQGGSLISKVTGQRTDKYMIFTDHRGSKPSKSPLLGIIPQEVINHLLPPKYSLSDLSADDLDHFAFTDYAHFKIAIRHPSEKEALQMVKDWSQRAICEDSWACGASGEYDTAANEAIWFVRQNTFLPFIEKELSKKDADLIWLEGLAINPDKKAMELLMKADLRKRINVMDDLSDERKIKMIPLLIDSLTHQDEKVRSMSEESLRSWTGQSFNHTWNYYYLGRLTLKEAQAMQPLWREWWKKNKKNFKIRDPYAEFWQQMNSSRANITNSSFFR